MGLDTKMKSLSCLLKQILPILLFDPINMLIRSIMQNATLVQISIGQFLSLLAPTCIYNISTIKTYSTQHIWVRYAGQCTIGGIKVYVYKHCVKYKMVSI